MSKTLLITMMGLIATATAAPYISALPLPYSGPYNAPFVQEAVAAGYPAAFTAAGYPAAYTASSYPTAYATSYPRADLAAFPYGDLSSVYGVPNFASPFAYSAPGTAYGYTYGVYGR